MKTLPLILTGLLVSKLAGQAAFLFDSGSSGAYGPMNITTNTILNLPADGIFHCTTITVASGATLRFNRNSNNTPVYLLATGDVSIAGTIDVSGGNAPTNTHIGGIGGPGGFDGGWPGDNLVFPGYGYGPGGGRGGAKSLGTTRGEPGTAGAGAYASAAIGIYSQSGMPFGYISTNKGTPYGSELLVPLAGGSGGGGTEGSPGMGGGGGGGAALVASNSRIDVSGTIRAAGGEGLTYDADFFGSTIRQHPNAGSGGAIRLVAPSIAGGGNLSATGPTAENPVFNHGRVRIDTLDRRYLNLLVVGNRSDGSFLGVFPNPPQRLDILNVAGTNIVEGSGPVTIQLPDNSPTNQTVTVQARGFAASIPIQVAVTPQSGSRTIYPAFIDNVGNNPTNVTVPVIIPPNTIATIEVWTKVP